MTPEKHIKAHWGKYTSILGVFPLIFLANIAMPSDMSFASDAEFQEHQTCNNVHKVVEKLDRAELDLRLSQIEGDERKIKMAFTKVEIAMKALADAEREYPECFTR